MESPSRWTPESQSHCHTGIQRFHKIQFGRPGWFPYDSRIAFGTSDSFRNKGLALAVKDHKELECDEKEAAMLVRKFKKFFKNNRYANQRNNKGNWKTTDEKKSQQYRLSQSHHCCIGRIREWSRDRDPHWGRNYQFMSYGFKRQQEWKV